MYVLSNCYHEDIQLSLVASVPLQFNLLSEDILKKKANDLEWLCGFSEAESLFYISRSGVLSFRIKLHWDDRQTLVYKNLLSELAKREIGVIIDSKNKHESYFTISKFQDI